MEYTIILNNQRLKYVIQEIPNVIIKALNKDSFKAIVEINSSSDLLDVFHAGYESGYNYSKDIKTLNHE